MTKAATRDVMALAIPPLWAIGAWQARTYSLWGALGVTAVLLAGAVFALEGRVVLGQGRHARLWLIGVIAGLAMVFGTVALFGPAVKAFPLLFGDVSRLYAAFGNPDAASALFLMPVIVVSEEIVWRGAVQSALAVRMPWLPAAVVGALVYALAHAPVGSPALVLTCLAAGFCWGALRGLTDSLLVSMTAHLIWDFGVLVVHQLAPPA